MSDAARRDSLVQLSIKHRYGNLDSEKVKILEAIPGWSWGKSKEETVGTKFTFDERCQEIINLMTNGDKMDRKIVTWIGRQRKKYREGTLSEEYITELQSIPGWHW